MNQEHILESSDVLKEKFKQLFLQQKKIKALENYGTVVDYDRLSECKLFNKQIELLKICLSKGFLDDIEAHFIDHMIKKVDLEYLYWSHKTKQLKRTMRHMKREQKMASEQLCINFDKAKKQSINVPTFLIGKNTEHMEKRA